MIGRFGCRFNGALSLELSNDHPNRRIIHRKVAMILGHWVSEVMLFYFGFTFFMLQILTTLRGNCIICSVENASYHCMKDDYGINMQNEVMSCPNKLS